MKWGVGRVVYETTMQDENTKCAFEEGINNGKLIVLPMYHLNMEQILPEAEDLKVISPIPGKKKEVYCMFGKPDRLLGRAGGKQGEAGQLQDAGGEGQDDVRHLRGADLPR